MRREWIEIIIDYNVHHLVAGLPPCGGSGLKWSRYRFTVALNVVSLHAEGVD